MEQDILVGKTIRVTTGRLVVGDVTYAVANITSVRVAVDDDTWKAITVGAMAGVLGLVMAMNRSPTAAGFLLVVCGVCLIFAKVHRPVRHIWIRTTAGEVQAFATQDKEVADKVLGAIHQAIGSR